MTTWGAPLTGAQMKLLRDAGLSDGTDVRFCGEDFLVEELILNDDGYHIPLGHIAYTLLEKGWLDGRNVRLWFGGDKAPDDRLAAGEVLLRGGRTIICVLRWAHNGSPEDVIAYIAKAEGMTTHADRVLADAERMAKRMGGKFVKNELWGALESLAPANPAHHDAVENFLHRSGWEGNQGVELALDLFVKDMAENDFVTIKKMTEADVEKLIREYDYDLSGILNYLGLIKSEPTLEERFWQGKERNSLSQDEAVKALVSEALNFERGK